MGDAAKRRELPSPAQIRRNIARWTARRDAWLEAYPDPPWDGWWQVRPNARVGHKLHAFGLIENGVTSWRAPLRTCCGVHVTLDPDVVIPADTAVRMCEKCERVPDA